MKPTLVQRLEFTVLVLNLPNTKTATVYFSGDKLLFLTFPQQDFPANYTICSLFKWAVTAVCLCTERLDAYCEVKWGLFCRRAAEEISCHLLCLPFWVKCFLSRITDIRWTPRVNTLPIHLVLCSTGQILFSLVKDCKPPPRYPDRNPAHHPHFIGLFLINVLWQSVHALLFK